MAWVPISKPGQRVTACPVRFASELVRCQGWVGICMEQKGTLSAHGGKSNILCPRGYLLPSARGVHLPGETSGRKTPIPFSCAAPNTTAEPNTLLCPLEFFPPIRAAMLGEQGAKPAQPLAQEAPAPKKPSPVCRDAAAAGHGGMRSGAALVQHPRAGGFWSSGPFP